MVAGVSSPTLADLREEKKAASECMEVAKQENRYLTRNSGYAKNCDHFYKLNREENPVCFKQHDGCEVLIVFCNFGACRGEWEVHSIPIE